MKVVHSNLGSLLVYVSQLKYTDRWFGNNFQWEIEITFLFKIC